MRVDEHLDSSRNANHSVSYTMRCKEFKNHGTNMGSPERFPGLARRSVAVAGILKTGQMVDSNPANVTKCVWMT